MPILQSFAATFSALSGSNNADALAGIAGGNGKDSASDQFSSLLDMIGNVGDTNSPQATVAKKDDEKYPVATAVDAPVAFRDKETVSGDRKLEKPSTTQARDNKEQGSPVAPSGHLSARPSARKEQNSNKPVLSNDSPYKEDSSNNIKDISIGDELEEKIAGNTDNLGDLLDIIARLLAGTGNIAAAQVNVDTQAVAAANSSILSLATGRPLSNMADVFADLKDVLAQLRQFLQAADSQNGPQDTMLSEEQNTMLVAINNALRNDLDALKNLLPQAVAGGDQQPEFPQASPLPEISRASQVTAAQDAGSEPQPEFAQLADVKTSLQNDISLIKDALQKFKNDHLASPFRPEAAITQSQPQAQPLIAGTENSNLPAIPAANARSQEAVLPVEQPVIQNAPQAQNNNATLSPLAAQIIAHGGGTGADVGSNSGQSGNSQQQFSQSQFLQGGPAASPSRSMGNTTGTQFSSLLNRLPQTPVTEQIVFNVKSAVGNGSSKITIQLHPEDLGKLDITLDVDAKGKAGVTITADNKNTLDLLQRDSQGLQKALSDAGLKSDSGSLNFNLRGGQQEGQGQNQSQATNQYRKSQPDESLPEELNIALLASEIRGYQVNLPDGLNIKI